MCNCLIGVTYLVVINIYLYNTEKKNTALKARNTCKSFEVANVNGWRWSLNTRWTACSFALPTTTKKNCFFLISQHGIGCCWRESDKPNRAPYCFYPSPYDTYAFVNMTESKRGVTAYYQLRRPSGYLGDFRLARLDLHFVTGDILNVKVRHEQTHDTIVVTKSNGENSSISLTPMSIPEDTKYKYNTP